MEDHPPARRRCRTSPFTSPRISRRAWCAQVFAGLAGGWAQGAEPRRVRLLLRSGWQDVNIGDIAHTPGLLALLEGHWPECVPTVWTSTGMRADVAAMIQRRFPHVTIVRGSLKDPAVRAAAESAEVLLHGSGPSLVAPRDVAAWVDTIGRPFGVYGITYGGDLVQRDLLSRAAFVFFRDSVSLARAQRVGIRAPVLEWAPDAAFAMDIRDSAAADAWLQRHGLEPGKFAGCIPRYRFTPCWQIRNSTSFDPARHRRNEEMVESDHVPLRDAIVRVVRELKLRVAVAPEDVTQVELGRRVLLKRLPPDVQPRVVGRARFWLPDEAVAEYTRNAGLFGLEMHSPILCIGHGVPAIAGRFAEQTSQDWMWEDIGLEDWLFDFDDPDARARFPDVVVCMLAEPERSRQRAAEARERVRARRAQTLAAIRAWKNSSVGPHAHTSERGPI